MFTQKEKRLIYNSYFKIIREDEKMIECQSVCTGHCWIVFKKSFDSNRPVTLYYKHTFDTTYYHKHCETWTVARAVDSIKSHDQYVLKNGETIRWVKQKGNAKYGAI